MFENICVSILLLFSAIACCQGQVGDPCNNSSLNRCDKCIAASPLCVWCPLTPNMTIEINAAGYENVRCRSKNTNLPPCPVAIEGPESFLNITRAKPLSPNATLDKATVQVIPQNVSVQLRRGEPRSFNMTFRSLPNTPLDLYFLFDFSSSLISVINTLKDNVENIIEEVGRTVSSAYEVGLGGFVDKPTLPYASTSNLRYLFNDMRNPGDPTVCEQNTNIAECEAAYAYRHLVQITRNTTVFSDSINNVLQSGNLDAIENGLEAVLQTAVCQNIIGWRSGSLRLLLIFTDQGYHIAGDGKLAGITRPNDGKCHLVLRENSGRYEYSDSLLQDYPSIRQVQDALLEANIVPVFVIVATDRLRDRFLLPYQVLSDELRTIGAQAIWFNKDNAGNSQAIVDVIRTSYDNTVQSINVNTPNLDGYKVDIVPVRGCEGDRFNPETGSCEIQFTEEVTYQVTITLEDCETAQPGRITLTGPPFTFTTIDFEPLCSCDCTGDREANSPQCSFGGDLECGACVCFTDDNGDPIRFGETCQCEEEQDTCPVIFGEVCAGNGICDECGLCACRSPNFRGDGCQCTFDNCPRSADNKTCSDRGVCDGDRVQEDCECNCDLAPLSKRPYFQFNIDNEGNCECNPDICFNPRYPDVLCASPDDQNVNGTCKCDGCLCPPGLFSFDNSCRNQTVVCNSFEDAARCNVSQTSCTAHDVTYLTLLTDANTPDNSALCTFIYDECTYTYYVQIGDTRPSLHISEDIQCPLGGIPGWIFAVAAVVAILLLGLLALFLIKLCFFVLDRIEYKRFQANLKDANFSPYDNPLYISPQQDYKNPLRKPSLLKKPSFL